MKLEIKLEIKLRIESVISPKNGGGFLVAYQFCTQHLHVFRRLLEKVRLRWSKQPLLHV